MIEGHDILCFAPGPWDDIWRNRHQIMTRLARANQVLYVEPWPELRPTLRAWRSGQLSRADLNWPRLRKVQDGLHVHSPAVWAPRATRFPLSVATNAVYMAFLRRALRQLRFDKPILWLFLPGMETFVGRFDEKLVIYHIVDEYTGYSGVSAAWRPVMQQMEERLARRADLVVVTSPRLLERKRGLNHRIALIPNAVDYEAFSRVSAQAPRPTDMAHISPPVAGYVGAINDKVDLSLLAQVARIACGEHGCQWSLVLVGPITMRTAEGQKALEDLSSIPNVHLLGPKSVTDVPRYMAACDVCLLPYQINEWTEHIDSLKLYEYLACAKPVVATDVPAARRFAGVVRIAGNGIEFLTNMNNALDEDSLESQALRREIAAQNTWEQRIAALSAVIEECLKEKEHGR